MKAERFINPISRAFWRRIEPYKNQFAKELPEKLPVEFQSFMGTALSWMDDSILVWTNTPSEPKDNAHCLIQMQNGDYQVGYYNDVQKMFALTNCDYAHLASAVRWTELD